MARIYIGGAGGAPSNNVLRSLRESGSDYLIGASSSAAALMLADVDERHVVPLARDHNYSEALLSLLDRTRPDLVHVQNDAEVLAVSRLRDDIEPRPSNSSLTNGSRS
jgi:carbamoyl-phosphate synthase large subunit